MIQDWDIKPRGQACTACNTAFEDKQFCYSFLVFGQEGYSRGDYCEKCWNEKGKEESAFSAWSGAFQKPAPPPEEPLKKETAEDLLRKLMQNEDPTKKNVIYILAVMLERKRILVEKDVQTRDDGMLIRVYEHKKTGETFLVPDPKLGFDQLGQVQQEVVAMLGMGPKAEDRGKKTEDGREKTEVGDQKSGRSLGLLALGEVGDQGSESEAQETKDGGQMARNEMDAGEDQKLENEEDDEIDEDDEFDDEEEDDEFDDEDVEEK